MSSGSFVYLLISALWWIGGALGALVGVLVSRRQWGAARAPQVGLAAAGTMVAVLVIDFGTRILGLEASFGYAFYGVWWRGALYSLPVGILIGLRFARSTLDPRPEQL